VEAAGTELIDLMRQMVEAENVLQGLRTAMARAMAEGTRLMRRVDHVTTALYGDAGEQKHTFGLRPIDHTRNSAGPTPQVVGLCLGDGPVQGAITARWKKVPRATYEVHWFFDESLSTLAGATIATRNEAFIPLAPGTQVWLRVRALRGKKLGEWSETATRIANV